MFLLGRTAAIGIVWVTDDDRVANNNVGAMPACSRIPDREFSMLLIEDVV